MNNPISEIKSKTQFQGGANFEELQAEMFIQSLSSMKSQNPIMIEIGSNDCFYSILFNHILDKQDPFNICIEVSDKLIDLGKRNVESNNCRNFQFKHSRMGTLDEAYFKMIEQCDPELWGNLSLDTITIKDLIEEFKLKEIDMLHMDIQGSEVVVLEELLTLDIPVRNVFVSTHKDSAFGSTHPKCIELFKKLDFELLFDNENGGGYGDGLIVAKKH